MRNCPGELGLEESDLRRLTLSVQAGFIVGTLTLAVTGLADRFGASRIFLVSSVLGALANAGFVLVAGVFPVDSLLRFATGLCLAGIIPSGHEAGDCLDAQARRCRFGVAGGHAHAGDCAASFNAGYNPGPAVGVAVAGGVGSGAGRLSRTRGSEWVALLLLPGPVFGLLSLGRGKAPA